MGCAYSAPASIRTKWFPAEFAKLPELDGKVIAITGTTSGTGKVLAEAVAKKGAKVLLLNRASKRAENSLADLQGAVPDATFVPIECDLQSFDSVRAAAAAVKGETDKLNALVCNAGVMALEDKRTKDGYDVQIQTNVLSHFLLIKECWPLVAEGASSDGEARVVTHSSIARFGPRLDTKYFEKCDPGTLGGDKGSILTGKGPWARYQQTKLADIVLTQALAAKTKAAGINVKSVTCHPGLASTNLQVTTAKTGNMGGGCFTNMFMKLGQSGEDGTVGLLHATAATGVENGGFYGPGQKLTAMKGPVKSLKADAHSNEPAQHELLWGACEKACGSFEI